MLLGSLNPDDKNVAVIGAGIAGLIACYRLLNAGYHISLHEKNDRAGGLIQTLQTPYGMAETAAHSVPGTVLVRQLFQDLNISIVETVPNAKGLIWRDGKMHKWPLRIWESATTFFYVLTRKAVRKPKPLSDWAYCHLGQKAVANLITPMTIGIYGTTPDRLEMPLCFPTMNIAKGKTLFTHMWSRRKNKRPPPIAPANGMQQLSDALLKFIDSHSNAKIHYNSSITELSDNNIVLCTPAAVTAELLKSKYSELSKCLDKINYSPLATATVFVKQQSVIDLPASFGVLFSENEVRQNSILGILFNSVSFKNRVDDPSLHSFTFMLGGTIQPEMLNKNDAEIETIIRAGLKHYLGWQDGFFDCVITRWPKAVPLYDSAVRDLLQQTENLPKGLALFGNYTGEVALRSLIETQFS